MAEGGKIPGPPTPLYETLVSIHTHTRGQCSHASVGLVQAHSNKHVADIRREGGMQGEKMKQEETEEVGETVG